MFSSISKAAPQTQASTSFVANRAMTIVPVTPFAITVNGRTPTNASSVSVTAGSTVTATITAPADWLWHDFYYYEIDGVPQSFAVINKSSYVIKIKPDDALKRWYLYTPTEHTLTYRSSVGTDSNLVLGSNYSPIDETYHVVLNPLDNGVYFYGTNGVQLSKVILPAPPIDYVKIPEKQSVVVLVTGGESYEIFLNNTVSGIAPFYSRRNYSEFTDLGFITQLPGEDLIAYLRRARSKKAIPPATCVTYNGIFVIAAGNGSVWIVDPSAEFKLIGDFPINEFVLNLAPLPDNTGVLLVTQSHKIYVMDIDGNMTYLYQGTALWQPSLFNGKVYIPESNTGYLKVYNPVTAKFEADIDLPEFSPSYTTVVDNKMYVCGHDSERVLVFDAAMRYTELYFGEKVTTVSVAGGTVIASHWLKDFTLLDQTDLRRVVKVEFKSRSGPVSHIGTNVVPVRTLGNPEVYARTPINASLWANGRRTYSNDTRGALLTNGDIISLSYAAKVPGMSRTNCIIGDIAYDYDVNAVAQTYYPRNINLEIQPPGDNGIHTRVITLPTAFLPSLMSVEYGTIKVNGAYYYGNFLVGSKDVVSIEINTKGNSALPVLTIGMRQFVIPVSTNPGNITPTVLANINLAPATPVVQEVEFAELPSLFDYIIPGYYNIKIKKNQLDITGNYYQQFGKGDKMFVEYMSSSKLYDVTDVYVLGSTNYKFTAKNILGFPLTYLDYGNISLPYTRVLDPYDLSVGSVNVGAPYSSVKEFAVPDIQYITANLTVSGLVTGTDANISITGGDSYFVVNGNFESNINTTVFNGDQIAIARNVVSYHDVPVYIIQHMPTGDEDGWADVTVGQWQIVNRSIDEPITTEARSLYDLAEQSIGTPSINHYINVIDALAKLDRLPVRNLHSYKEQIQLTSILDSSAPSIRLADDAGIRVNAARESIELYPTIQTEGITVDLQSTKPAEAGQGVLTLDPSHMVLDSSAVTEKIKSSIRVINSATQELDKEANSTGPAPTVKFDKHRTMIQNASVLSFEPGIGTALPGSTSSWLGQPGGTVGQNKAARFVRNIRTIVSNYSQRDQIKPFVFFDLRGARSYGLQDITLDGSRPQWTDSTDLVPETGMVQSLTHGSVLTNAEDTTSAAKLQDNKRLIPAVREKLSKPIGTVADASYTADRVESFYTINEPPYPAAYSLPTAEIDFIKPISLETNAWIDKDTVWQGFIQSLTQEPAYTPLSTIYLDIVNKGTPAIKFGLQTVRTDYIPPLADNYYYSDREQMEFAAQHQGVYKTTPSRPIADDSQVADILKMNPQGGQAITFATSGSEFILLETEDATSGSKFISVTKSSTIAETIAQVTHMGQTPINKMVAKSFRLADPARSNMIPATSSAPILLIDLIPGTVITNYTMAKGAYESEVLEMAFTPSLAPLKELPINLYFDQTVPAPSEKINLIFEDMLPTTSELNAMQLPAVYVKALPTDGMFITTNYVKYVGADVVRDDIRYASEMQLPTINVIPVWAAADYGMDSIVIYSLQHQQQNVNATTKIKMVKDNPNHYFTYMTVPDLEQGIVWEHDISVPYGAFATEADAIYAARNYTEFRPYLIMDTDLWSYRVILDTGLVCRLPKGRYPIAWLIRGG